MFVWHIYLYETTSQCVQVTHTKMKVRFEEISPISLSSLITSQLCRGCSFSKCIINYMQFYNYLLRVLMVIKMSRNYFQDCTTKSPWTKASHFLPTTRKITQFSEGKEPKPGDKIVYTAGAFDLFRILNIKNVGREDRRRRFYVKFFGVHQFFLWGQ